MKTNAKATDCGAGAEKGGYNIPAVAGTLAALEFLCRAGRPVSQAEICQAAGMSATTGYRMVQCLLQHRWLQRHAGRSYTLAAGKTLLLAQAVRSCLIGAQPILDELAARTQLSCKLSVREGAEQVALVRAESPAAFAVAGKIGARFPVIEGSVGAALLASAEPAEVQAFAEACTIDIPEKKDPQLIFDRIQSLSENGYSCNHQQNRWRVEALSMPVRDRSRSVAAALTLVGIAGDINDSNVGKLAAELTKSVKKLEESF